METSDWELRKVDSEISAWVILDLRRRIHPSGLARDFPWMNLGFDVDELERTFLQNNRKKSKSEGPNLKIIENPPLLLDLLCDETETAMMSTTRLESEHDTVGRARRRRWSGGLRQTRRAAAEKRELKTGESRRI
ncbi:hypothetical protein YC2023_030079 [Brassica napus]